MADEHPLIKAVTEGDKETVARLLRQPTDPSDLVAALCQAPTVAIARLLVAHGADANLRVPDVHSRTYWGASTPIACAVAEDRLGVARYLIENGAIVNETTVRLHYAKSSEMMQLLIDHGASLEVALSTTTPLLYLVQCGPADVMMDLIKVLIQSGANVNATAGNGTTVLMKALQGPRKAAVRILLEAGALVNVAESCWGNTPLHVVVDRSGGWWHDTPDVTDLAELLIAKGADLRARNLAGEMPIHIARRNGNSDLVALLERAMEPFEDPYPPLPGPPQSGMIRCHPHKSEAITTVRYAGLARWSLDGEPRLLARVQTHFAALFLAVSSDGDYIAITYEDTIHIRRWNDLSLVSTLMLPDMGIPETWREWVPSIFDGWDKKLTRRRHATAIALSPDGRVVAVATSINVLFSTQVSLIEHTLATVYILDRTTGEIIDQIDSSGALEWMAFADNALLLDGNDFGTIEICVHPLDADYHSSGSPWCFGPEPAEEDYETQETEEGNEAEPLESEVTEEVKGESIAGDNEDEEAEEDEEEEEEEPPWPPYALNTAAISPSTRWIAYVGSWGDHQVRSAIGQIAVHSLSDGELIWHRALDVDTIGKDRFDYGDFGGEVLFLSDTELVCSATRGTLLFFDAATGILMRRYYLDTDADVGSLSLDRRTSTLWITLSDGQLASLPVPPR